MKLQKPSLRLSVLAGLSLAVSCTAIYFLEANSETRPIILLGLFFFSCFKAFGSAKLLDTLITSLERKFVDRDIWQELKEFPGDVWTLFSYFCFPKQIEFDPLGEEPKQPE